MSRPRMWRTVLAEPGRFVREEVDRPSPGPGEVLIRVARVGVCGSDISAFHGRHPYIRCPIVLGHEFSGVVTARGSDEESPTLGTRVTVIPHLVCGQCEFCRSEAFNLCENLRCIGAQADGAHAEYVVVPAPMAVPIPDNVSFEDAALVEPASVSYHAVKRVGVGPSDRILVVGAGPIGIFALQSAKVLGAKAVYIADLDASRLALADSLGADGTINVASESLDAGLMRLAGGPKQIDVLIDCVGGQGAVLDQLIALARRGSRVLMVGVLENEYEMPHLPDLVEHELALFGTTMYVPQDYREVVEHLSAGRVRTTGMITHTYSLQEIPTAFEMIESGREKFFKIMFCA